MSKNNDEKIFLKLFFNNIQAALKLPQGTDEEKQIRDNAMQDGLKKAIQVRNMLRDRT